MPTPKPEAEPDIEAAAAAVGIDTKANVRQALIDWRDNAMKSEEPHWSGILLLTHAIWWLSDKPVSEREMRGGHDD